MNLRYRTREVTPWFSWQVRPAHVGVYQRMAGNGAIAYAKWNGAQWLWSAMSASDADEGPACASLTQTRAWRGLSKRPTL